MTDLERVPLVLAFPRKPNDTLYRLTDDFRGIGGPASIELRLASGCAKLTGYYVELKDGRRFFVCEEPESLQGMAFLQRESEIGERLDTPGPVLVMETVWQA